MKSEECTCGKLLLVTNNIDRIATDAAKLRQAVVDGIYDPRSIVGDAVLRIEGQLRQIREHIPPLPPLR